MWVLRGVGYLSVPGAPHPTSVSVGLNKSRMRSPLILFHITSLYCSKSMCPAEHPMGSGQVWLLRLWCLWKLPARDEAYSQSIRQRKVRRMPVRLRSELTQPLPAGSFGRLRECRVDHSMHTCGRTQLPPVGSFGQWVSPMEECRGNAGAIAPFTYAISSSRGGPNCVCHMHLHLQPPLEEDRE